MQLNKINTTEKNIEFYEKGESEESWCMKNVKMCIEAQNNDLNAIHINTVNRTPEEIVKEIIAKSL